LAYLTKVNLAQRAVRLRTEAVSIGYGHGDVVQQVSCELAPGRVTALVGPNGSGKSTLLRGMARLQRLSTGAVLLEDEDVATLPSRELARRLTVLAQSRPTPQGITVRDAVEFGRHPHRGRWRGRDAGGPAAVQRAMELTGVATLATETVDALSGGQLQRVWLASCLAQDTAVLMLDEPTNHLDLRYQVELLELLRDLAEEHHVTVGVVLHDLNHAAQVADVVAVLSAGRLVACGAPAEVLTDDLLTEVYGIEIAVSHDDRRGCLDVRPRARRSPARRHGLHAEPALAAV
jgi:ferric hydroxamate transport system ATP-binding protein